MTRSMIPPTALTRRATAAELATATAFVAIASAVALRSPYPPAAVVTIFLAYACLAIVGVVLIRVDLATHRLPNAIVLPSLGVGFSLFVVACLCGADWASLVRAGAGSAALFVFYAILHLVRRAGMGGGDVKLAAVLGAYLAWCGWAAFLAGSFAAFFLGGAYCVILLASGRADRRTPIAFGPWMIVGAWMGIATSTFG